MHQQNPACTLSRATTHRLQVYCSACRYELQTTIKIIILNEWIELCVVAAHLESDSSTLVARYVQQPFLNNRIRNCCPRRGYEMLNLRRRDIPEKETSGFHYPCICHAHFHHLQNIQIGA